MVSANTSKIAINNEIVLMRQAVRQSRVAIVRKLIKEAKILQARKHGNEHVQEKCKRKAQRLLAEIAAMKKLKDDEITKFGITNNNKLPEVLNDTTVDPATRIMTRVAFHKTLCDRIVKFKEKFPEYEQHLGPGRRKLSKIQRQADRQARNALRKMGKPGEANDATVVATEQRLESETADKNVNDNSDESSNDECEANNDSENEIEPAAVGESEDNDLPDDSIAAEHNLEPGRILRIDTSTLPTKKRKANEDEHLSKFVDSASIPSDNPKKKKSNPKTREPKTSEEKVVAQPEPSKKSKINVKNKEEKKIESKVIAQLKKPKPIKIVSKEATVKRFADLANDEEPDEFIEPADVNASSKKRDTKIEKEVDSFFMTENGESEYLSVVVPRPKPSNDDNDDENDDRFGQHHVAQRQRNFHERNNKFFSKIDQRANGSYGDKFGANVGRPRRGNNDFENGRGSSEKFGRNSNNSARPIRNGKSDFEKKSEPQNEELHPSWAARKKQQEILKQGFQGKKIIFDN